MENFKPEEQKSYFGNIIGGTDEQKKNLEQRVQVASRKTGEEIFGELLLEPTPEEDNAIKQAVEYANLIARQYGSSTQFDTDRIFILESGGVALSTEGRIKSAVCNSFDQSIGIDRSDSTAMFALAVVHEMLHMNSYHSSQILEDGQDMPYRSGISMKGRKEEGEYFGIAMEAIIATLTRKFFDDVILQDPQYKEEIERTNEIKKWLIDFADRRIEEELRDNFKLKIQDILILQDSERAYEVMCVSNKTDAYKFGFFQGFFKKNLESGNIFHERSEEREKFNKVLDRIMADSNGKISSREVLFDEFARAHFTGNYLTLGRMIDDALGKGSFRKIAIELGNMSDDAVVDSAI